MRRFSSEGSLLDLDFPLWKKESGTYTPHLQGDELDGESGRMIPIIQEPTESPGEMRKPELSRKHSMSAENLSELGKLENSHLGVCVISETSRAYSDSQLFPATQVSTKEDHLPSSSASPSSSPFKMEHRHQQGARLSAAKLHLKSLFTQSPHSSNSNLANTEHKDSAKERRSRILFMHQWSQVGHSKKRKFNHDELEKWAESLNSLLASGVSVFGAFLRSEFSEENLQFYLACEQYRHSSNNFSLQRRARDICATYIQPGAPREVNLDSKTRELTIQLLQAPSRTSLSHAQKRIYSLLDSDCYPRFLQSDIYLSLLQEAD
uniref:RGS domain-containing protein n=1 Tax=Amphilophus citrinellus TaxID=61819 RepID=A0A3Q0T1T1_AMPCI